MTIIARTFFVFAFVLAFSALGYAQPAHASYTPDQIYTYVWGGMGCLYPGVGTTCVHPSNVSATQYVVPCPSGGTLVTAGANGYPSGFLDHPNYFCSVSGYTFYYGHQVPALVAVAPIISSPGVGSICLGGPAGCATFNLTIPPSAYTYYVQSCSAPNACGVSASGAMSFYTNSCVVTNPSLPAGYGTSCTSAANACGYTNSGTIGCSGTCSAAAPALPSNYGKTCTSAANSCGMTNTGTYGCSGVCSASVPSNSLCAPVASCTVTPSSGYAGKTTFAYTASATGGNGTYAYSWSGTDGLSGATKTVTKAYTASGSKTATVVVTSNGKSDSASCTPSSVTVNSCNPALSASPSAIDLGQTANLNWSIPAACASSCAFSDGHAVTGQSGSYTVTPPTPDSGTTDTYALTCPSGSSNTVQADVTVRVPTVSISVSPDRVRSGDSSTVTWSSTNVDSCDITRNSSPWKTGLTANVSRQVNGTSPDTITAQTTYKITCVNDSGQTSASATGTATVNLVPGFEEF